MRIHSKCTFTLALSLCAMAAAAARANVINVPGDQPTIQAGINVAASGDTVLVAPGSYSESIDFMGKAIAVQSSGGALATTITATGLGTSTVKFISGEGGDSVLDGFTVTGGAGTVSGSDRFGGGIYAFN